MRQEDVIERLLAFFRAHSRLATWLKRAGKLTIILAIIGIISGFSLLRYSKKPEFCKTCHYMKPFYDAWKTSSHNRVPCVECHYAPGIREEVRSKWEALSQVAKYVTGTYGTKPWAEISDRSCLRSGCHDKRLLRGKVLFENVLFDHTSHLTELRRGKRLRCTSCHSQIVQGEHMTVTPSTCVLCHFKGQEEGKGMAKCSLCHTPPTEPVTYAGVTFDHADAVRMGIECTKCHLQMTQGRGNVPKERCYSCHLEPERIAKYDDSILLHDVHITEHKVECTACHLEMEHRITGMSEAITLDCNSCHPDHHAAQKELYMGIGGEGVPHRPDPMFLTRVNCEACHIAHEGSKIKGYTRTAPAAACMSCHGVKYGKMLEQWEGEMKELLEKGVKARKVARRELEKATLTGEKLRRARSLLERASYNIDLVDYGRGVHNIGYSQQLIAASLDSLGLLLDLIGSKARLPEYKLVSRLTENECYRCHFGMYSYVRYRDQSFPHEFHVVQQNIPCLSCHTENTSPETRDHGKLSVGGKQCASCHHKPEADCRRCHPLQERVYKGDIAGMTQPDFMAQAEVDCEACHLPDGEKVVRPGGDVCVSCHDESYADLKNDWQKETREKIEKLQNLVDRASSLRTGGADIKRYRLLLETARKDGSSGVHNFQLLDELLGAAETSLEAALEKPQ